MRSLLRRTIQRHQHNYNNRCYSSSNNCSNRQMRSHLFKLHLFKTTTTIPNRKSIVLKRRLLTKKRHSFRIQEVNSLVELPLTQAFH